jgi:small ligand-binding sensory domain FIST
MRFVSAISDRETTPAAMDEILSSAVPALATCDAAFVFFTAHHREEADDLLKRIQSGLKPRVLVGCSAEGVIGENREIERTPGIAILAGQLPGVKLHPFHIPVDDWRELLNDREALKKRLGCDEKARAMLGFGDPFTTPMHQLLPVLDRIAPKTPLIGGMASSGRQRGENVLLLNGEIYDNGFVGVSVSGGIEVETVVSQGCRPIGMPLVVTKGKDNVIQQLSNIRKPRPLQLNNNAPAADNCFSCPDNIDSRSSSADSASRT